MPEGSHEKIKSIDIFCYQSSYIWGFQAFDKEGNTLYQTGMLDSILNVSTVLLEDDEMIIGVIANLRKGNSSASFPATYNNFQFQIATKWN